MVLGSNPSAGAIFFFLSKNSGKCILCEVENISLAFFCFGVNVTKIGKSRTGESYEVIAVVESSTGRSTTQTTSTIAAPGSTDDRNNNVAL